jgi:hypothetical protein
MARSRISLRVLAGLLSATFHLGLIFVVVFSGGRSDGIDSGQTPVTRLVLIEGRNADHRDGIEAPPLDPAVPTTHLAEQLAAQISEPPSLSLQDFEAEPDEVAAAPQPELTTATITASTEASDATDAPSTFVISQAEEAAFLRQLARTAGELASTARTHVTWEQNARKYNASFIVERAKDGVGLDRVIAEVSAEDHGKQLTTRINLKRLAFSNYTQMIDRWDPTVQLHDDEIDGRFHINSQFNLMYDRRTAPKFLGKVTTAARSFNAQRSGRRRDKDIFRGGIETRAGRIAMPEHAQPFAWAPRDENARIHELVNDTRIRFFADGTYTWRDLHTKTGEYHGEPSEQLVYFIAKPDATLYVKGVVAGSVLIYSPETIIVEGNLTYAHDPRDAPDSRDYLGLVSDRTIQLAPARVTGPGDINIHAAIFARRRFVVTNIDHPRSGTLRIYGSLAAGTVSATEPRYATKIEYDRRFEERRPPGFPSTDQFAVEGWDGLWTEARAQSAEAATADIETAGQPGITEARAED